MKLLCKLFGHKWPYAVNVLKAMAAIENKNNMPRNTTAKCLRNCGAIRDLNAEVEDEHKKETT